jgi:hypothetical protein
MQPEVPLPLTPEEHREIGREVRATVAHMRELSKLVVSIYGARNRTASSFVTALEALNRLEADLRVQAEIDGAR